MCEKMTERHENPAVARVDISMETFHFASLNVPAERFCAWGRAVAAWGQIVAGGRSVRKAPQSDFDQRHLDTFCQGPPRSSRKRATAAQLDPVELRMHDMIRSIGFGLPTAGRLRDLTRR